MPERHGTILVVDDDPDILTAAELLLRRRFARVITSVTPEAIPELLPAHRPEVVLLDLNFGPGESSGEQGLHWIERIVELDPETVIVTITAHGGVDVAVEAMKRGATDFIAKPWQNEKVVATVSAAAELCRSRRRGQELEEANRALAAATAAPWSEILGTSAAMRGVLSLVDRAAPTDASVLVLGENGTGKELVAREVHRRSHRADRVFLAVDLGALSESLFESELFGHQKGAFTGADRHRAGRFQAAAGGTIFLDEIGNIPLHLQAKLLTVLEQRRVTPVGSDRSVEVDVRVVSATNLGRDELSDPTRFRQDLLFRLNTVEITLPPLRERREDIPIIAAHYAEAAARHYARPVRPISEHALAALCADPWPGNVRALRHAVERAVILAHGPILETGDFQLAAAPSTETGTVASDEAPVLGEDLNLERLERAAVERALNLHGYNISRAARQLGLTRAALYRRMEKYGL